MKRRLGMLELEALRQQDPLPETTITHWIIAAQHEGSISEDQEGFFLTPVQSQYWNGKSQAH